MNLFMTLPKCSTKSDHFKKNISIASQTVINPYIRFVGKHDKSNDPCYPSFFLLALAY